MPHVLSQLIAASLAMLASATSALAVTFSIGTTGGLMQQPTSHYYHAVYGGYVESGTDSEKFLTRVAYIERPEFKAAGFIDKDYGYFALIGTKVTKTTSHGLYAYFGAGKMAGYIKQDPNASSRVEYDDLKERDYAMPGPTALLEYMWRYKGLTAGVNHQTFIGYQDKSQLRSYVAWPYNFFQVNLSYCL